MEEEKVENTKPKKTTSPISQIITTQIVWGLIIILSVLTVKYFFKGTYKELKEWYKNNAATDTHISEVLEDTEDEN